MELFALLPLLIISIAGVSYTLPQNDIAEEIAAKLVSEINKSQDHRINDALPALGIGKGCRIKYETKFEIEEIESVRQECRQWTENKCTTKQRPKCTHVHDNVCETKYRQKCRHYSEKKCNDSWRNECVTREKDECDEYNRQIEVPYEEDECLTRKERRCEKHWEEPIVGTKVWVDDPATCKFYDTTDCKPVTKYRTETEKYTKCQKVPYQHCDRVKDTHCFDVPKQECHDEPWQDCHEVIRDVCVQESYQDCQDYPRRECKDVHEKIPKQVTVQVPIRVCDGGIDDGLLDTQFDGSGSSPVDGDFVFESQFSDIIA